MIFRARTIPVTLAASVVLAAGIAAAQSDPRPALNENRILGVIPNYQTVSDSSAPVRPLRAREKWSLFVKETVDPFNIVNAALGSGFSQAGNETPKYGVGGAAFGMRFGAALADFATQNFFSAGVLATVLHQDPRYFRKGPQAGLFRRIAYSASRIVVARQDSGAAAFNASGVLGMMLGIGASNLYYPTASMRSSVMVDRLFTSLTGSLSGNLLAEFWPDVERKLMRKRFLFLGKRSPAEPSFRPAD